MIFWFFLIISFYLGDATPQPCQYLTTQQDCTLEFDCSWVDQECKSMNFCARILSQYLCRKEISCAFSNGKCQSLLSCSFFSGSKSECEKVSIYCTSDEKSQTCVQREQLPNCKFEDESCSQVNESKNFLILGKTGVGKSYFLNLLMQEPNPKKGFFKPVSSLESGTEQCEIAENAQVYYGEEGQKSLTLNLIDTPGLFDTNDDTSKFYYNESLPYSIQHLKEIDLTIRRKPFQMNFNAVLLAFESDQKFDVQHKQLLEISTLLMGKNVELCAIITRCQNLYDKDKDNIIEIIQKLQNFTQQWRESLAQFGVYKVFFFKNQPENKYIGKNDEESKFYYKQWREFYVFLESCSKTKITFWEDLQIEGKNKVGRFFNYKIGKSQEQIDEERKLLEENLKKEQQRLAAQRYQMEMDQRRRENEYRQQQENNRRRRSSGCISLNVAISGINSTSIFNEKILNNQIELIGQSEPNFVLGYIHFSKHQEMMFLKLIFRHEQHEGFLELTNDHLIYCPNRQQFIRADQLTVLDTLLYESDNQQVNVTILNIINVRKKGFYTPLTYKGQFFGNGILLSSYVSLNECPVTQELAHFAMKPLIFYRLITMNYESVTNNSKLNNEVGNEVDASDYQAPYTKILQWIFCHE